MQTEDQELRTNDHQAFHQIVQAPKNRILTNYVLHQGKCIRGISTYHSGIVFITKGLVRVTSICSEKQQMVRGGEMFFVPRGRTFHFYALEDTYVLTCNITVTIAFCEKHPIGELMKYIKTIPEELKKNEFGLLPIHPYLLQEVKISQDIIHDNLDVEDFQKIKRETILLYMRHLYTPMEKAFFFLPLLNEDMRFLSKVLEIYRPNISAQEFIDISGMSASTFNRKFRKSFGLSLGTWLNRKKADLVKEDIILSELTMQEIADKYLFSPNHLTKFCKMHFGVPPSEIREHYNNDNLF